MMTKQIIYAVTFMVCFVLVMIIIVWLVLYFVQYWAPLLTLKWLMWHVSAYWKPKSKILLLPIGSGGEHSKASQQSGKNTSKALCSLQQDAFLHIQVQYGGKCLPEHASNIPHFQHQVACLEWCCCVNCHVSSKLCQAVKELQTTSQVVRQLLPCSWVCCTLHKQLWSSDQLPCFIGQNFLCCLETSFIHFFTPSSCLGSGALCQNLVKTFQKPNHGHVCPRTQRLSTMLWWYWATWKNVTVSQHVTRPWLTWTVSIG